VADRLVIKSLFLSPEQTTMVDAPSSSIYEGLLPRRETQALDFCQKHPQYDGSNVLIGILDTGIDPGAAGIRYMKDGQTPKLIDMVDCTGSGDVNISTEKMVVENEDDDQYYHVQGLSGKQLKMKKSWWKSIQSPVINKDVDSKREGRPFPLLPTVKLGIKPAFELFPSSLVSRVKAHRKRHLDQEINAYLADIQMDLAIWQEKFQTGKPTPDDVRTKEELQARLDVLTDIDWETEDPGMILDCVVFYDGEQYRAVLYGGHDDKDEEELDKLQPLAAFSKERQYGTISIIDMYNYGVNFYDDASVLSIVGDCTPHGTHVAAIATVAEGPDRSGVAPGAKLISIKIGDSRLGSMETTSSLARGIMTAIRLGCDVINLSYGEGCQLPNSGRVIQLAEELVWRHNIIFVAAVGNNGPALSTVNAPGGMSSCILGVAAYVSPEMMKAEYSLTSNTSITANEEEQEDQTSRFVGTTYTWSSVGPSADGSNGVCFCAPGGAITSVSNWTMQKSMLMNGTSMASPHACGCVALLLSACKAEGIPISPSRIHRALENSAKPMPGLSRYQQGWGMIQVEEAYKYLQQTKDKSMEDLHFEVYVEDRSGSPRGIYLRQPEESSFSQTYSVRVNPRFKRGDNPDEAAQLSRIGFEIQFALSSSAPWVNVPEMFMLMNNGRSFKIDIDPSMLPPGVHTATVRGHVAGLVDGRHMWSLPITVVKPLQERRVIERKNIEVSTLLRADARLGAMIQV
jgi:tripeptidyl-peptidase II